MFIHYNNTIIKYIQFHQFDSRKAKQTGCLDKDLLFGLLDIEMPVTD